MAGANNLQVGDSSHGGTVRNADILEVFSRASDIFRQSLADDFPALGFLKDRCGLSDAVIDEYGIGVSGSRSWELLAPKDVSLLASAGFKAPGKASATRGQWAGRDIVLPVRDKKFRVVGFMVQPINGPGAPMKPSYSTGDSALLRSQYAVFGLDMALQAIQVGQPVILVSSALEVLSLAQRELRGAVAPLSLPFSPRVIETLQAYSKDIIIVCPGDREMVVRALDAVMATQHEDASIQFAFIPKGSNNCVEFMQFKGASAFIQVLERATPTIDLLHRRLIASPDLPASKKGEWVVRKARGLIESNPSEKVRKGFLAKLEVLAGVRPPEPVVAKPPAPDQAPDPTPTQAESTVRIGMVESDSDREKAGKQVASNKPAAKKPALRVSKQKPVSPSAGKKGPKAPKGPSEPLRKPKPTVTPPWVDALLASDMYQGQRDNAGRMAPDNQLVSQALSVIASNSGRVTVARLCSDMKIPAFRGRGMVAGLCRIMNVDGVSILSLEESTSTVKLDQAGLMRQFNITGGK